MVDPRHFEMPPTQVHSDPHTESSLPHDMGITERKSQLVVLSGPEQGRVVEIHKSPFVVGKGDECDLVVSEPTVSRQHFTIDTEQGAFVIRDRGSTNGTWIDQFRIREAWLRPGTVLRAGQQQLRFEPVFKSLDVAPAAVDRFGALVGKSVRMRQIFTLLQRVARTEATVVIFGETGTGKSAVAQAIHEASPRKSGPFVTVDCGAIAENLIESELFGHEKGAFTGADRMRQGALERAQGGTLFIDELVDLRLDLQPRLLRVLEEREVRRVGSNTPLKLDVRIIAASRFDLWREVQEKRFREDLYFRLAVFTLPLPSLRERKEDIPLLASSFARAHGAAGERLLARVAQAGHDVLVNHPFPGNVRELRNVIERAITLDADPTEMLTSALAPSSLADPSLAGSVLPGSVLPGSALPGSVLPGSALPGSALPGSALPASSPSTSPAAVPSLASSLASSLPSSSPSSAVPRAPSPAAPPAAFAPAPTVPVTPVAADDDGGSRVTLAADCTLPFKEAKEQLLEQFEAAYFKRLFSTSDGNASAIARAAGIDRKHLYTLARKHNLAWKGRPEG